jgi:hypothetical protein
MKMEMIVVGEGARMEGEPFAAELNEAEMADEQMYESMAPRGNFTSRGLAPLVRATNALLPLFGQTPDYPEVEDTEVLPTDFTRILAMFSGAVDEAIQNEVLKPEMAFDISTVRDDSGLLALAGKLEMLAKDRSFKAFLEEPVEEDMEMEMEGGQMPMEEQPMSEEDMDAMFMERM